MRPIDINLRRRLFSLLMAIASALCIVFGGSVLFAQPKARNLTPLSRVTGRVVDNKGDPIADAELFCEALSLAEHRGLPTVAGRSGSDGSFELTTGPGTSFFGDLWVHSPGYALQCREAAEFAGSDQEHRLKPITLTVPAATRILLTGPDNRPRGGELIEPERLQFRNTFHSIPPRLREVLGGLTDTDGFWQTSFLDHSSSMSVRVISETFGVQMQRSQSRRGGGDWVIRLSPVGTIVGRIVTNDPARFAGQTVKAESIFRHPFGHVPFGEDIPELAGDFDQGEATAEIDSEGRFRIPGIIATRGRINLSTPLEADWATEVDQTFELAPGASREVKIAAVQKVPFQGSILLSDGTPAAGVQIELSSGATWPLVKTVTRPDGTFECKVCPGDVSLNAHLPAFGEVPVFQKSASVSSVTRGVSSEPSTAVADTLRLPELKLVEGTVVDSSGKSIPRASVEIWQEPTVHQRISTDAEGRFWIYRTEKAAFNQFKVFIDNKIRLTRDDAGEPLVVRVLE